MITYTNQLHYRNKGGSLGRLHKVQNFRGDIFRNEYSTFLVFFTRLKNILRILT